MRANTLALVAVLLLAAYLRMQYLVSFVEWPDEIRSVWRVEGSFDQAISRVPGDWPPLYTAILWLWQQVAGPRLEASRLLSVLFSLLALAFVYRATRSLVEASSRRAAARVAALAYAVMAYSIFAGVDVRAYGMLLMLGALAFWLTLRWLRQATWRRILTLAGVLAAMIWSSYTSFAFIPILTLFVLVMRPRQLLRWVGVGIATAVLVSPLLAPFLANAAARFEVVNLPMPSFPEAMIAIYTDFGGSSWFLIPLGTAIVLIAFYGLRSPQQRRRMIVLTAWVLFPVVVYFTATSYEFWKPRYMWWVLLGLALLLGCAAVYLPRSARWGAVAALVLLPLAPVDWYTYRLAVTTSPPFRQVFGWLAQRLRPEDVLVIDPNCTCGEPLGWDYFLPQYFPTGNLPVAAHPGDAARVWYLSTDGWPRDEQLLAEVMDGRRPSIFVGPWNFLLRLYEGPPSRAGVPFGDSIRLNGAEVGDGDTLLAGGQSLAVKLWWSTTRTLDVDYSISVALLDGQGQLVAQVDGPATAPDTPPQTSAWQSNVFYEDYRTLQIPPGLSSGQYRLVVTVYQWWDNVRLPPRANVLFPAITDDDYLVVRNLQVIA
jgi:hypothetical protein